MDFYPKKLTVQWHITDRCNLRCRHCYQESYVEKGFALGTLKAIAAQVFDWHAQLQDGVRSTAKKRTGSVASIPLMFTITGGEPCAHPDFDALLVLLSNHPSCPSIGILSNGSLICQQRAELFKKLNVAFVQLSVEGRPEVHDGIRGEGNFQDVVRASNLLKLAGVPVIWSFTAHHNNFREFPEVVRLAQLYGVSRVWSDRMIPVYRDDAPLALNAQETTEYLLMMGDVCRQSAEKKSWKAGASYTHVAMARALQFQAVGGTPYHCHAGHELVTIMPDGTLYPCRRLPVNVGNVLQTPLRELYESPLMQALRNFEAPRSCEPCVYKNMCKGGLRCLAYVLNQDMFSQDPGCEALSLNMSHSSDLC